MTNNQNTNEWFSIERLLMKHNITAIEAEISGDTLQVYDHYNCRILANDHNANDQNSKAFALQILSEIKSRLDKDRPYFLQYSDYDETESLHSPLNRFGWTHNTLPTFPPRWMPLVRYLEQGTAKLAIFIKKGSLQVYEFDGLTLNANDNDLSDINSKVFVLKILADRQERINHPEPEYDQLHKYCTEDEIKSLERFGWFENSLPQFSSIDPYFTPINEASLGVTVPSLEVRKGKNGSRDNDAMEWFLEKSLDPNWNINNLAEKDIRKELQNRDHGKDPMLKLWSVETAYAEWNRGQKIWPKRTAGRKKHIP